MKPLVSLITTGEPVTTQTYDNLEIVAPKLGRDFDALYDDGSTGAIHFLAGTLVAKGDYFAYQMPGDTLRPDHIASLVEVLERNKAHFAYSQCQQGENTIGGDPPRFKEIVGSCCLHRANLILAENWRDGGEWYDWDIATRWLGLGARWAFLPKVTVDRP